MKMKSTLLGSLMLAGLALGASTQANANANAYAFGYTYPPTVFGPQELILNGTTIIQASFEGWYDFTGDHSADNPDYIVGNCSIGICGGAGAYNNFFVFDLSSVTGPITSAALSLGNPSNGYSGAATATYTNYDVSTPISALVADQSGAADIYNDLGSGTVFATTTLSNADNGTQVGITLDSDALASLTAAEGSQWAIGGTLGTFIAPSVPEPATWAMMLVGFGAIGFAARRAGCQRLTVAYA